MNMKKDNRPLSPHLTVYKPQITSVMSIFHRMTGVFQSLGTLSIFFLIFAVFVGEQYYDIINFFFKSLLGKLFIFFYIFSICYHLCNGIRHLSWDLGYGFEIKNVYLTGYLTIIAAIILNIIIWLLN